MQWVQVYDPLGSAIGSPLAAGLPIVVLLGLLLLGAPAPRAAMAGLNLVLIVASNSTGGVMGKMIDAQSIVVAAAATGQSGGEGRILRFVFLHSLALAGLVGLLTLAQAYLLTWMIPAL